MNRIAELLDRVAADLAVVLRADTLAGLSDVEKMRVLRAAGEVSRRVDAVVVETVGSVDQRPAGSGELAFCGQFGCRTMNELVQRVLRTDAAGAGRVVKAGRAVRREVDFSSGAWLPARWPALREALLDGAVGLAGVLAATGPVEQAGPRIGAADRLLADAELAEYARGLAAVDETDADAETGADADAGAGVDSGVERSLEAGPPATPEDLKLLSRVIVTYLDPDGAEPVEERAMRARGIVLGRVKDGVIPIRGSLLPETAGQLQRIWDAYLNPKVDGPPVPDTPVTGTGVRFIPSADEAAVDSPLTGHADDDAFLGLGDGAFPGPHDGDLFSGLGDDDVLPSGDAGRTVDDRSRAQKQHDALAAVLGIAARHHDMPSLGGAAPTLVVSVTAEDYTSGRGWAHIDGVDDAPVTLATA
ncbi:DUF222 domain-containing protein, partial [Microbacterium sp. NPDC008134]|uniref:DUF222 domain-containing protein n=1 Tax=Microbacterium sp. NPDC008134 TaxID=3364183 RepID=UPI0036DFB443